MSVTCRYPGCDRAADDGWTMCTRHHSAGRAAPTLRLPDGRLVRYGQELSVDGLRGRFRWMGKVGRDGSLELWGGVPGRESFRSVRQDRVKVVHRKNTTRKGSAE